MKGAQKENKFKNGFKVMEDVVCEWSHPAVPTSVTHVYL